MRICDDQVMLTRFDNQFLLCVEVGETGGDFNIVRLQAIDLPEHRDGFEREILRPIMFGDAPKTRYRSTVIANANMKIAKDIERSEVARIVLNNLAIFFYRRWDFPHFE